MSSKFGIFGGFRWIRSLILVDEPGFWKGSKFGFSGFGPGFERVQCLGFSGQNLGRVSLKFKAVRS